MVKQQSVIGKQHTGETSLKMLFSSAIRADVLALLLNNPDEKFYVREIANLIRKNPSRGKGELDNLEKMGGFCSAIGLRTLSTFRQIRCLRCFQSLRTSLINPLVCRARLRQ